MMFRSNTDDIAYTRHTVFSHMKVEPLRAHIALSFLLCLLSLRIFLNIYTTYIEILSKIKLYYDHEWHRSCIMYLYYGIHRIDSLDS